MRWLRYSVLKSSAFYGGRSGHIDVTPWLTHNLGPKSVVVANGANVADSSSANADQACSIEVGG